MKKGRLFPALELVCLTGILGIFYFLQLLALPDFKNELSQYDKPYYTPTVVLIRVHELLQPPWLAVFVGLLVAGIIFMASRAWRNRMPKWHWVPSLLIVILGIVLVRLVVIGVGPYDF